MTDVHWKFVGHDVAIERLVTPTIQILRLRGYDNDVVGTVCRNLDIQLSRETNRAIGEETRTLTLAPGEWMLVGRSIDPKAFAEAAAGAKVAHLADVGAGYIVYSVTGPRACDLIAKGCSIDLHPRTFEEGCCAQSLLAQVYVVIDRPPGGSGFLVYADASYVRHLDLWFADAGIEFRFEESD